MFMESITEKIEKLEKSVESIKSTMTELKGSVKAKEEIAAGTLYILPTEIILIIQELFQFVEDELGKSNPPLKKKIKALLEDYL